MDSVSERVGKFNVWFNDFKRFDQQLHLLIDLNVFRDSDEQLLLLLKVSYVRVFAVEVPSSRAFLLIRDPSGFVKSLSKQ